MTVINNSDDKNLEESIQYRDFLIEKKSEILSQTRSEIDTLYDIINSDQKNIDALVWILQKNLT